MGLHLQNNYGLLPWNLKSQISYSTNFDLIQFFFLEIEKQIKLSASFKVDTSLSKETADFDQNQYHSYNIDFKKVLIYSGNRTF
jgi:hypothetical protein